MCWRAPSLPRVRYKILPARLLGGENGTKLSLHVEKAPNRAILGERGEFCTGSGAVWLVLGEFCTGSGAVWLVLGEFCTAHAARAGEQGEFCTGSGSAWFLLGELCCALASSSCQLAGYDSILALLTGTAAWPSVFWCSTHRRWWGCVRNSSPCVLKMTQNWRFMACWANSFAG